MPDAETISTTCRTFPTDDSLCERCGYPLKGLSHDAVCPECGLAVAESSPVKRFGMPINKGRGLALRYVKVQLKIIFSPRSFFRALSINEGNPRHKRYFFSSIMIAAVVWFLLMLGGLLWIDHAPLNLKLIRYRFLLLVFFILGLMLLTCIEMIGVTAFSKRRGWRVPFHLAERVCCYASVAWVPGVAIAAAGYWLLEVFAAGQPWFEQLLGLVRVGWLCYAGLFILSLLWFETLVWIGVRQVKYANAWPVGAIGDPGSSLAGVKDPSAAPDL